MSRYEVLLPFFKGAIRHHLKSIPEEQRQECEMEALARCAELARQGIHTFVIVYLALHGKWPH